jgi:ribosomal protein L15
MSAHGQFLGDVTAGEDLDRVRALREAGHAKRSDPVKILARGDVSKKLTVRAHGFSAAAKQKIEAAGGTCETLE